MALADSQLRTSNTSTAVRIILGALPILLLYLQASLLWFGRGADLTQPGDFAAFWASAVAADQGLDPYDPPSLDRVASQYDLPTYYGPLNYPPIFLVLLKPFAALPFQTAVAIWQIFLVVSFAAAFLILARSVAAIRRPYVVALMAFAFLASYPVQASLEFGNIDPFILLLLVIAIYSGVTSPGVAGAVLGFALAVKVVPAIFVAGFFTWSHRWRLLAILTAVAVVLTLLGVFLAVPDFSVLYVTDRIPRLLLGDYGRPVAYAYNQALGGFFGRLFTSEGDTTPWVQSPLIALLAQIVVDLALVVVSLRLWSNARDPVRNRLAIALVLPLALLLPRLGWNRYAIWLLPAYVVAVDWLLRQRLSARAIGLGFLLSLSYALSAFLYPFNSPSFFNTEAFRSGPLVPLTSLPMFGTVLLWVVIALMLKSEEREPTVTA